MDTPMRLKAIAAVCGILVSPGLSAQPAPAPAQITQRLDNEQVRVIVATLQPHTPSIARTGHATNRVLIYLDDGVMTREEAGNTARIEFHRGDVRWRPASGAYTSENVSDHPIRILEVDLKGPPKGQAAATKLDPVAVDPTHFDDVRMGPPRIHIEENASDQPADAIAVELK
jgi:hypothetical protein